MKVPRRNNPQKGEKGAGHTAPIQTAGWVASPRKRLSRSARVVLKDDKARIRCCRRYGTGKNSCNKAHVAVGDMGGGKVMLCVSPS